jgi:hypothetical protein
MAAKDQTIKVMCTTKIEWWVKPAIYLCGVAYHLGWSRGIAVAGRVAERGVSVKAVLCSD